MEEGFLDLRFQHPLGPDNRRGVATLGIVLGRLGS